MHINRLHSKIYITFSHIYTNIHTIHVWLFMCFHLVCVCTPFLKFKEYFLSQINIFQFTSWNWPTQSVIRGLYSCRKSAKDGNHQSDGLKKMLSGIVCLVVDIVNSFVSFVKCMVVASGTSTQFTVFCREEREYDLQTWRPAFVS